MAISRKWWEPSAEDGPSEDEPRTMTRYRDIDDLMILSMHGIEMDITEYTRCRSRDLLRDVAPLAFSARLGSVAKQGILRWMRALRYFCREPGSRSDEI